VLNPPPHQVVVWSNPHRLLECAHEAADRKISQLCQGLDLDPLVNSAVDVLAQLSHHARCQPAAELRGGIDGIVNENTGPGPEVWISLGSEYLFALEQWKYTWVMFNLFQIGSGYEGDAPITGSGDAVKILNHIQVVMRWKRIII